MLSLPVYKRDKIYSFQFILFYKDFENTVHRDQIYTKKKEIATKLILLYFAIASSTNKIVFFFYTIKWKLERSKVMKTW